MFVKLGPGSPDAERLFLSSRNTAQYESSHHLTYADRSRILLQLFNHGMGILASVTNVNAAAKGKWTVPYQTNALTFQGDIISLYSPQSSHGINSLKEAASAMLGAASEL